MQTTLVDALRTNALHGGESPRSRRPSRADPMNPTSTLTKKNPRADGREAAIRNVVGFAHEVRIHFHDTRVLFASVLCPASPDSLSFVVRPWGLKAETTVRFEEVSRAAPVKQMGWQKQRTISAAQAAGVFEELRPIGPALTPTPKA
jgi:hypothetical protein